MATDILPDQFTEQPRGDELGHCPTIFQALLAAKKEFPVIPKSASGLHSKYAKLEAIEQIIQPILFRHGLTYIQPAYTGADKITRVRTVLIHESGETLSLGEVGFVPESSGHHPQASAMSYAKRYSVCSALTITCEDEDDDGNSGRLAKKHMDSGGADAFFGAPPSGPYHDLVAQIDMATSTGDLADAAKNIVACEGSLTAEDTEKLRRMYREKQEAFGNGQ